MYYFIVILSAAKNLLELHVRSNAVDFRQGTGIRMLHFFLLLFPLHGLQGRLAERHALFRGAFQRGDQAFPAFELDIHLCSHGLQELLEYLERAVQSGR